MEGGTDMDMIFYHSTMQGHHFMELKTQCPCWQDIFHFGREKNTYLQKLSISTYLCTVHTYLRKVITGFPHFCMKRGKAFLHILAK